MVNLACTKPVFSWLQELHKELKCKRAEHYHIPAYELSHCMGKLECFKLMMFIANQIQFKQSTVALAC